MIWLSLDFLASILTDGWWWWDSRWWEGCACDPDEPSARSVFLKCISGLYLSTVFVNCISQVYFSSVFVNCICKLYLSTVFVNWSGNWQGRRSEQVVIRCQLDAGSSSSRDPLSFFGGQPSFSATVHLLSSCLWPRGKWRAGWFANDRSWCCTLVVSFPHLKGGSAPCL